MELDSVIPTSTGKPVHSSPASGAPAASKTVRALAVASLAANIGIVVTGGAVRLTACRADSVERDVRNTRDVQVVDGPGSGVLRLVERIGDSVLHSDCGVGTGSDGTCTCTEGG